MNTLDFLKKKMNYEDKINATFSELLLFWPSIITSAHENIEIYPYYTFSVGAKSLIPNFI